MDMDSPPGSPPTLDPSTLALLDDFLASKADEEHRFHEMSSGQDFPGADSQDEKPTTMSMQDFRLTFGEDWQLSQFWYSDQFAYKLGESLMDLISDNTKLKIGFMCCPSGYVAFQYAWSQMNKGQRYSNARLLEIDQRFATLAGDQFVLYDIFRPAVYPEEYVNHFDIIVADPPFLNEDTNSSLKETLVKVLNCSAKFILLSSPSIEDVLMRVYDAPPVGPLRDTQLEVTHGQLANAFRCWGNWNGAEIFGTTVK